jgi:CHAT domain-containing protein
VAELIRVSRSSRSEFMIQNAHSLSTRNGKYPVTPLCQSRGGALKLGYALIGVVLLLSIWVFRMHTEPEVALDERIEHLRRPELLLRWLTVRGKTLIAQRRFREARVAIQRAIETVEGMHDTVGGDEVGRAQFMDESRIGPYHLIVDLLVREHKWREALIHAERAKARALLDIFRAGNVEIATVMNSDERERDRQLTAAIASVNREIFAEGGSEANEPHFIELRASLEQARLEYEFFRSGLFSPNVELNLPRKGLPDLNQLQRLVSDGRTALVEFVVTEEKTHAFVITATRPESPVAADDVDISGYTAEIGKRELSELVNTFAGRLSNPHIGEAIVSRRLYDLLLKPARPLLAGKDTLVIVPDDILWAVPFQALRLADDRFVIENYSVCYAPSLAVLGEIINKADLSLSVPAATDREAMTPSLLLLGNPTLSIETADSFRSSTRSEQFAPLPEAEEEVRAIAKFYRSGATKLYVGADAGEDRIKLELGDNRIIHLATHGILDSDNSIVLLSKGENGDDGLLEAREIMRLRLNADLAVLSACETAGGRAAREGVIGMSWAFLVAGCRAAVVSQWKIDSASTAQLMIAFHRNLALNASRQQSTWKKADSLRVAMLTVMKHREYKDPYYWAGFVLVGDGR